MKASQTVRTKSLLPIYKFFSSFPGSVMLIPLLISAIIFTVSKACGHPDVWREIGDPIETLFAQKGVLAFLGALLFIAGAQTDLRKIKEVLHGGLPLLLVRFGCAYGFIYLAFYLLGGQNGFMGLSFVAIAACLACPNAALFNGITAKYSDDTDRGYFGLGLLFALPAFPLIVIEQAEEHSFDPLPLISMIVPLALGLLVGNLDRKLGPLFAKANPVIMLFLGFQFGSYIDLTHMGLAIPSALLLLVIYYGIVILPSLLVEVFLLHKTGYMTLAMSGLAGVALSIPRLIADGRVALNGNELYQLSFVLIVSGLLAPALTNLVNRWAYDHRRLKLQQRSPLLYKHVKEQLQDKVFKKETTYAQGCLTTLANQDMSNLSPREQKFVQEYAPRFIKERQRAFKLAQKSSIEDLDEKAQKLYWQSEDAREKAWEKQCRALAQTRAATLKTALLLPPTQMQRTFMTEPLLDPFRPAANKRLKKADASLAPLPILDEVEASHRLVKVYLRQVSPAR